jgi:hypothetical protein
MRTAPAGRRHEADPRLVSTLLIYDRPPMECGRAPFRGLGIEASNPRRVKQFVNLLNLRLMLLTSEVKLTTIQLGKLTAAEILFPRFIADLARDSRLLNKLLLGTDKTNESYALWSSKTQLLELLAIRPSGTAFSAMEILIQDRHSAHRRDQ